METIRLEHVTFSYPLAEGNALDDVSFAIQPSEFIVLCGKSGCGKSTLLKQLKKNLIPYGALEGSVLYCGEPVAELDDRRSVTEIGFVQQNPDNQIVTDKVWHELAFGLESLGMDNASIKRRVAEMASYFDIQGWFRKSVSQLSGGQKQLLNLASIMAMQPKLLILDEPTSQLDPIAASEFLSTIYKINRDLGTTILISEHRLEEIFPMADKVMVMDQGRIIAFDEPGNIGEFLSGDTEADRHPMFYGLPAVMRIFASVLPDEKSPLTIREGRLKAAQLLEGKEPEPVEPADCGEESPAKPVITVKDLWFKYSKTSGEVLRGLNLSVEENQWYCLLGGNGTGKSTTLKVIAGILKGQRGSVKTDLDVMSMLPQNPQALFTEITVEEELLEALHYTRISDQIRVERVNAMLQLMEIEHLRKANPYDLSGGEQQRLALGKILLLEPKILLLDEPTKGLDPFFKRTLAGILRRLVDSGVTIFMVSHDVEFCAEYADKCAMFFDGDIVSIGTPKAFFSGNSFYTTTANKIIRQWKPDGITCEEVAAWLKATI
ncbi:ABC transporter ATP-binding protein [Ihubacter sp. mB4P-1]|uniref:ABC transporter ATP-binding protein n=1 Tax=Ihubacter sp. mB4P-1 TaxID=3242370 RepID=UPI001379C85C